MLQRTIDLEGNRPDILVDGKPAEIREDKHGEFWVTYCDIIASGRQMNVKQLPIEAQTLVVRFGKTEDLSVLEEVVRDIQAYLRRVLVFDRLSDNDLRCIVTASEDSTSIYFPHCRLIAREIEALYIPALSRILREKYHVDIIPFQARTSIPLYGSTPEDYLAAYDDVELFQGENSLELSDFTHLEYSKIEQEVIREDTLPVDRDVNFWLPMILSIDYWRSITRRAQQVRTVVKEMKITADYNVTKLISNMPIQDEPVDLDFYLHFIRMWRPDRLVDITYWKVVGQAFFTLEHGDSRGLNGWIDVLKAACEVAASPNCLTGHNIRKKCTDAYSSFVDGEIDVTSLAWYARIDSREEYTNWHTKWVMEALTGSMSGTEAVIGRAFWRCYWLDFMANAGDARTTWYRHINNRLVRDMAGISLRILMSNSFLSFYTSMKSNIEKQKLSLTANAASCDLAIIMIDKVIERLGQQRFKQYLLKELTEKFRVQNIASYIDADPNITLIKNGVLTISGHEVLFREGKPQDYLVKSFDAAYNPDYSWSHPKVKELWRWSYITFIDPATITFHWKFLSSLLRGGNNDKKLVFWSGPSGNNMKTTWQRYVSRMLGPKAVCMPINYFTMGKGSANSATAAECKVEGARAMFSEEADSRVPFLSSIVKAEVGNDRRQIRELYGDSRDIDPQHKTIVVVNNPPPIAKEPATQERVVIIEFGSQAVYDPPDTEEERVKQRKFPRDPLFDKKLPGLIDAGLWIMVQMFPLYSREGIVNQPEEVLRATREYWNSIDKYVIFIADYILQEPTESLDPFVLYTEFYRWHEKSYKKMDIPDKRTITAEFTQRLGEMKEGLWQGYTLRKRG